jgi:glucokinase
MPHPSNTAAVGVSISSNRLRAVYLDPEKKPVGKFEVELNPDSPASEQVISQFAHDGAEVPICIAVPGMVETGTSRIVDSRVSSLSGSDLKTELTGSFSNLKIENDANALAYAEYSAGAGKGARDLFCISLGEGVGSGLILNGEIWRGANGYAGEFGAIVIDEEGTRLEDVASIPNIVRRTRARFHQDSTTTLKRFREDEINFREILDAASLGDDFALLMLERTGTYVGTALAAVINLLNVDRVVIAGEVIGTPSAVLDAITRRARQCSSPRTFGETEIVLSTLDEFGPANGAAMIASEGVN